MQERLHLLSDSEIVPSSRDTRSFDYVNRELSWIEFNRRVLEEALDESIPLLERLRFLCIFSNNLDEFFMIRVSGLKQQISASIHTPTPDGYTPTQQLEEISNGLRPLLDQHLRCLTEDVLPGLAREGLRVFHYRELTRAQQRQIKVYFEQEVFPILTPLVVDPGHPFPHISNLSLNLGVEVSDPDSPGEVRFARIKVPETLPRLVPVPNRKTSFVLLEEIVAAHIGRLFPGMQIVSCHPFRITRDADLEIEEDEAEDLLQSVQDELRRRRFGLAVRLQVDHNMPIALREGLCRVLRLSRLDLYPTQGPLGVADFIALTKIPRGDLMFKPFEPTVHPQLREDSDCFKAIRDGDILLHHPFDSFEPVVNFIRSAAQDPQVLAIKQTLYRTSGHSAIIDALISAAENGKQVAVIVELKARFDEETNIQWARKLEEVGVHVIYGLIGLKIHAKITLVIRRERDGLRRYVHLGTGNYNPATAKVYTDIGILTCNHDIGSDASELFNFLTGYSKQERYRKLATAPFGLRDRLLQLISREEKQHRTERPGHIIIKCNQITDIELIDALYHAGKVGVQVDLIVRGTCCIRAGVSGLSENIRVRSVVGRFLEHSRLFYFSNDGHPEIYASSADWMTRNMDRRVEIVFPVEDAQLKSEIYSNILMVYLKDNQRARILQPDGRYIRATVDEGQAPCDTQKILLERASA